jgi:hypothetical protein
VFTHLELELMNELRERRGRSHPRLRQEPERPAAGRPGRPARDHGPRPRHPHRLQGRRGRRHRQAARHRHHLPARAAPRLGTALAIARLASAACRWSPSATAPPAAKPTSWAG